MKLLLSNTKRKVESLFEKTFASEYTESKNYVVLVPDRRTLEWEKRLHEAIGKEGSFNIEVCSFRRFAQKTLGPIKGTPLSPEGAVMLMSKAIKSVKDNFRYFKPLVSDGFTRNVYSTITALRSSDVKRDMLEDFVKKTEGNAKYRSVSEKTSDILLIYQAYESLLSSGFTDGTTMLEELAKHLRSDACSFSANVWCVGFNTFNARQLDVLLRLIDKTDVTVALPSLPLNDENKKYYDLSSFVKIREHCQGRYKIDTIQEYEEFSEKGKLIYDNLYSFDVKKECDDDYFEFLHASHIEEEVKSLAVLIRYLLLNDAKVRFNTIGVTVSEPEKYKKSIEKFFSLYDIPYHLDVPEKLGEHALVRFTQNAMKAVVNNLRREDVLELVKSPFVTEDYDLKNIFENYVLEKNINFAGDFENEFQNEQAEIVRKKLTSVFDAAGAVISAKTIGEAVQKLKEMYVALDVEKTCQDLAKVEKDNGFSRESELSLHISQKISSLLEDMSGLLSSEPVTKNTDFPYLFRDSIAQESITLLPPSADCVLIRTPENSDFYKIDYLFILGANQGVFPMETSDSPIISLKDKDSWYSFNNNMDLKPTVRDDLQNQRFEILQLLSGPYKHVTALYSGQGRDNAEPSFAVKNTAKLFGKKAAEPAEPLFSSAYVEDFDHFLALLGNITNASFEQVEYKTQFQSKHKNEYFDALKEYLEKTGKLIIRETPFDEDRLIVDKNPETAFEKLKKMYFGEKERVGVTGLENYFKCPFSFFLSYGLGLRERRLPDAQSNDFGNIIHDAIYLFFKNNSEKNYYIDKTQEDKDDKIVKNKTDFFVEDIINDRFTHFFRDEKGKLDKESLKEETFDIVKKMLLYQNRTGFHTSKDFCEYSIDDLDFPALKDGETVVLKYTGRIDRVDEKDDENYRIVFDYKTFDAEAKLKDLYFGKKIQLFIYIDALTNNGQTIPAGIFYVPISAKKEKDKSGTQSPLKNPTDKMFAGWYSQEIKEQFDNSLVKGNESSVCLPHENFIELLNYARSVTENALKEILDGFVGKKPLPDVCTYCLYKDVCNVSYRNEFRSETGFESSLIIEKKDKDKKKK